MHTPVYGWSPTLAMCCCASDALLGINLARTGKLNGENWKVFENTQMDEDTQDAIGGLVLYAADCSIRNIQNPLVSILSCRLHR